MKSKEKSKPKQEEEKHTTATYLDPGKGIYTRRCFNCDGSGRVYEGGYGNRDCPLCVGEEAG